MVSHFFLLSIANKSMDLNLTHMVQNEPNRVFVYKTGIKLDSLRNCLDSDLKSNCPDSDSAR